MQWYDANISLPGCDKNMPGTVIAMARLNRPSLMVYGGTIKPGVSSVSGQPIDVISAFQSYGVQSAPPSTCLQYSFAVIKMLDVCAPLNQSCRIPAQCTATEGPLECMQAASGRHTAGAQHCEKG